MLFLYVLKQKYFPAEKKKKNPTTFQLHLPKNSSKKVQKTFSRIKYEKFF